MRSKFSCVRSSHNLCARAHAHSFEGTFDGVELDVGELCMYESVALGLVCDSRNCASVYT